MSTRQPEPPGWRRVLAVDASAWSEVALRILLQAAGYEVRTARDARQALALAAGFRPHLVLVELDLPDMDGFTLIRRLKDARETSDAVVVALTSRVSDALEGEVLASGAAGLMTKPVDPAVFRDSVRRYLRPAAPQPGG